MHQHVYYEYSFYSLFKITDFCILIYLAVFIE